jgi:hypothetical protein
MNKVTKDFFTRPHPGFQDKITIDDSNVLGTNVPIVELDMGLNVDIMLEDARRVEIIDHVRAPNPFAKEPRYMGWQLISLWNLYPARKLPHIPSMVSAKFDETEAPILPKDPSRLGNIINEFDRIGLPLRRVIVTVMKPGAYVSPHRDISFSKSPLNYVWIPLNYPAGSHFGVFPKGEIEINLGSVYLLNQENFPHAVANDSNEYRYVLAGWLDMPHVTKNFLDLAKNSIQTQYQNNLI